MVAHSVYFYAPNFSKGYHKEADPRKWWPLPGDEEAAARQEKPEVIHLSKNDIKELNRIKALIK